MVASSALLAIVSFFVAFRHLKSKRMVLPSSSGRRSLQITACNGLENLCDKRANEIMFATAHNANSALKSGELFFPNHKRELENALYAGYRGINMDIGLCDGKVTLVHGPCFLATRNINTVLNNIVRFLSANPNEVLIMPCQLEGEVTLAQIDAEFEKVPGWKELLYSHPGPGIPWPTLRDLIEANTRVLFFHHDREPCSEVFCPPGFHDWFLYAAETEFEFLSVVSLKNKDKACRITRGGSGTRDFFGTNVFTTPPTKSASMKVNKKKFLKEHVQACRDRNGGLKLSNLLLVDFWHKGDVLDVVHDFNAEL